MRRLILLVLVSFVACERSESPTGPSGDMRSVQPRFSFTGGSGKVLGSTNQGELVEIDLDAKTVMLIGDAGIFAGDSVGWTDIAFDDAGTLYGMSRIFFESDFQVHLYTIDPSSGAVLSDVGSMGDHAFSDFDHDGTTFYGSGAVDVFLCCGQLFTLDAMTAQATWISSETEGFGPNPFDTVIVPFDPIARGGFAIHPVTGDFWGIEALQSQATVLFRINPATGLADSVMKVGPPEFGYDALHILDDGTFIAARGGPFPNDSVLWEIDPTPDSLGVVPIQLIPLTFAPSIVGNLNGLEGWVASTMLAIDSIATEPDGGTFTTMDGEATITGFASVVPSGLGQDITWTVSDATDDQVMSLPPAPAAVPQGTISSWLVPPQDTSRWPRQEPHPGPVLLDQKSLAFEVVASVVDGQGVLWESDPEIVRQDEIDTIRQEYVEFLVPYEGLRVPGRSDFAPYARCNIVCVNNGDYSFGIVDPRFEPELDALEAAWPLAWQVNVIYRNPVHQRAHVASVPNSWHQYGCAADLQTFPVPRTTPADVAAATAFWDALFVLADQMGFDIEPMADSGVGHVHVEIDCPEPIAG